MFHAVGLTPEAALGLERHGEVVFGDGAHLVGGIALILYLVVRRLRLGWLLHGPKNSTWHSVVGLYWHTMDGIWLWLFGLLLIFR